jgi:hypothetical protein
VKHALGQKGAKQQQIPKLGGRASLPRGVVGTLDQEDVDFVMENGEGWLGLSTKSDKWIL